MPQFTPEKRGIESLSEGFCTTKVDPMSGAATDLGLRGKVACGWTHTILVSGASDFDGFRLLLECVVASVCVGGTLIIMMMF